MYICVYIYIYIYVARLVRGPVDPHIANEKRANMAGIAVQVLELRNVHSRP